MANIADPDQKPTDLDLHCLQNRVYPGSAGQGLRVGRYYAFYTKGDNVFESPFALLHAKTLLKK